MVKGRKEVLVLKYGELKCCQLVDDVDIGVNNIDGISI